MMKPRERSMAFFGAMLVAFGLSSLDLEYPDFKYNQKEYIAIIAGLVLLLVFYINFIRNRR